MYTIRITAPSAEDTKFSSLSLYYTSFLENKECKKRSLQKTYFFHKANPVWWHDYN